jgi:hypothetical protein
VCDYTGVSEPTTSVAPEATARESAPSSPARTRGDKTPTDLDGIARAMLRARGVKDNGIAARLGDQKKVLRGRLRTTYWPSLVKSAPKSYGPKGTIKKEPNDRRPWGAIPADVARTIIKNAKR